MCQGQQLSYEKGVHDFFTVLGCLKVPPFDTLLNILFFRTILICEGVPTTNANLFLSGFQTLCWLLFMRVLLPIVLFSDVLICVYSNLIFQMTFVAHKYDMFSSVHITY